MSTNRQTCKRTCHHPNGLYSFKFVSTEMPIKLAQQHCKKLEKKGNLASNLKKKDYDAIKSCCQNSQQKYWIGLINDNTCKDSSRNPPRGPYHWIEQTNCTNAAPLELTHQPNNNACKAVTLFVAETKTNAEFFNCNNSYPFICKVPRQKRTTTATNKRTTTATNKRTTTPVLPYTTPQNRVNTKSHVYIQRISTGPAMISNATTFHQDKDIASASLDNPAATAGAILGSSIVILLVLMLMWRFKKGDNGKLPKLFGRKKKKNSSRTDENKTNQEDPSAIYYKITPSSPVYEPDNLSRENFNEGTYSTPNKEEAAYQIINYENTEPTSDCVYAVVNKPIKNDSQRSDRPTTSKNNKVVYEEEPTDSSNACSYVESNADVTEVNKYIDVEEEPSALYASVNKAKKKKT